MDSRQYLRQSSIRQGSLFRGGRHLTVSRHSSLYGNSRNRLLINRQIRSRDRSRSGSRPHSRSPRTADGSHRRRNHGTTEMSISKTGY